MNTISVPASVESLLSPEARNAVRRIAIVPLDDGGCHVVLLSNGWEAEIEIDRLGNVGSVYHGHT
jgi:hypothetical protein